jgi:hypothetical protein
MIRLCSILISLLFSMSSPVGWGENIPATESAVRIQPHIQYIQKEMQRLNAIYDFPNVEVTVRNAFAARGVVPNQVVLASSGTSMNWDLMRDKFYAGHLKRLQDALSIIQKQGYAKAEDLKYLEDGIRAWHQWEEGTELMLRQFIQMSIDYSVHTSRINPDAMEQTRLMMETVEGAMKNLANRQIFGEMLAANRQPVLFPQTPGTQKLPPGQRAELAARQQQILPRLQQKRAELEYVQKALADLGQARVKLLTQETPEQLQAQIAEQYGQAWQRNTKARPLLIRKQELIQQKEVVEKELLATMHGSGSGNAKEKLALLKQIKSEIAALENQLKQIPLPKKDQQTVLSLETRLSQLQSENSPMHEHELAQTEQKLLAQKSELLEEIKRLELESRSIRSQLQ